MNITMKFPVSIKLTERDVYWVLLHLFKKHWFLFWILAMKLEFWLLSQHILSLGNMYFLHLLLFLSGEELQSFYSWERSKFWKWKVGFEQWFCDSQYVPWTSWVLFLQFQRKEEHEITHCTSNMCFNASRNSEDE